MHFPILAEQIKTTLSRAQRVLLIGHRQPDADALGSIYPLAMWLRLLNVPFVCYCPERADAPNLYFLSDALPFVATADELTGQQFDVVVVVDSGDLRYAGVDQYIPTITPAPTIINIDHHATNQHFGTINFVETTAASTTEMLYKLFAELRVPITPDMANALLAGIINDTYNFTNSNTSAQTFSVTSELLRRGANLPQVNAAVLNNKTIDALKVWGRVLGRMVRNDRYGVATAIITLADVEPLRNPDDPLDVPSVEVVEGIANFLNNLGGIRFAMVLRELPDGRIKGSFRTNDDSLDVSKLAMRLGGGGHKKAAGFTIPGRLEQRDGAWRVV
jgi:phosphoesterase RecJ-like protein